MKRMTALMAVLALAMGLRAQEVKILGTEATKFGISMSGASIETQIEMKYSNVTEECICAVIIGREKWATPKTPEEVAEILQSGISLGEQVLPLSKKEVKGTLPVSVPMNTRRMRGKRGSTDLYAQAVVMYMGESEEDELRLLAVGDMIKVDLEKLQRPEATRADAKDRGNLFGEDIVGKAMNQRVLGGGGDSGKRTACSYCGGSGVCGVCDGHGSDCKRCNGTGKCHYCGGSGTKAVSTEEEQFQNYQNDFLKKGIGSFLEGFGR